MTTYELRFGDLDFSPAAQVDDFEWRVYGLRRGSPVPVTQVAESMFRDGADESIERYENRDQQIVVGIRGADSEVRAAAEHALVAECMKPRNELTWTPQDGYGAPTVFEVEWANPVFDEDGDWDLLELRQCELVWVVTIRARPFGMSLDEVVDTASDASSATTVTISDGSSATNWSSPDGISSSSGVLAVQSHSTAVETASGAGIYSRIDYFAWSAVRAMAATSFAATPYVSIEVAKGGSSAGYLYPAAAPNLLVNGVPATLVASSVIATDIIRATYRFPDSVIGAVTSLEFAGGRKNTQWGSTPPAAATVTVSIDNVIATNQPFALSSTGRATLRSITVQGSTRTEGRIEIGHATKALGTTFLYSRPGLSADGTPDMRRWRTAGGTITANTSTVSGSYETVGISEGTGVTLQVPASTLPRGGYLVYVRAGSSSGTIDRSMSLSAATLVGTTPMGKQTITSVSTPMSPAASDWPWIAVGELVLPPADVPESSAAKIELKLWASGSNVLFDELLLFYAGPGTSLSLINAGTAASPSLGSAHNYLWLDTPTLDNPQHAIWLGTQGDRSDAFFAGGLADGWGTHPLEAGDALFYLVNTGEATYPSMTIRHRPHWWLNAQHVEAS